MRERLTLATHVAAGGQLLELYAGFGSASRPLILAPPPDVLPTVAAVGMAQDDWGAAVAAALALADVQLQPAAELFAQMMGRLQTSNRSISLAAQGISVLHKAECYADASKVGMLAFWPFCRIFP